MPSFFKYLVLLALATSAALATPQGNSQCAHFCQDYYQKCGFKNVGQCVSNAAHNGFECECCPSGKKWCDNKCCDIKNDNNHCGGCGQKCDGGRKCKDGKCECPDGKKWCDNKCCDIKNDNNHCGGCGQKCNGGKKCDKGECK